MNKIKLSMLNDKGYNRLMDIGCFNEDLVGARKGSNKDSCGGLQDYLSNILNCFSDKNIRTRAFYAVLDIIANKEYEGDFNTKNIWIEAYGIIIDKPIRNINIDTLTLRDCYLPEESMVEVDVINCDFNSLSISVESTDDNCLYKNGKYIISLKDNSKIENMSIFNFSSSSLDIVINSDSKVENILLDSCIFNNDDSLKIKERLGINSSPALKSFTIKQSILNNAILSIPTDILLLKDTVMVDCNVEDSRTGEVNIFVQFSGIPSSDNNKTSIIYNMTTDKIYSKLLSKANIQEPCSLYTFKEVMVDMDICNNGSLNCIIDLLTCVLGRK